MLNAENVTGPEDVLENQKQVDNLVERLLNKDKRALSRIISHIENEDPIAYPILKKIYKHTGNAYRIGITGPPGAGKSTSVNVLAKEIKNQGYTVGIIAVDPTSPFTGGALLGDRIRMTAALMDPDIYMRSMASRGGVGGLAQATPQAADAMDAFGFDVVIIETVGVGQLELDVAGAVDTTVVILVPEAGGSIQAMKAGLIEIADIFAINKADRDGAEILKNELRDALSLMPAIKNGKWDLPIELVIALENKGIKELVELIWTHRSHLVENNLLTENRMAQKQVKIMEIIKHRIEQKLLMDNRMKPFMNTLSRLCVEGKMDPITAAGNYMKRVNLLENEIDEPFLHR